MLADMHELRAVFVAGGPGAFSALRVGMSTAKTLADSLEIPLVSIGTLDVEASPYIDIGAPVRALIEAGKSRLYIGRFESGQTEADYELVEYEELGPPANGETLFCGGCGDGRRFSPPWRTGGWSRAKLTIRQRFSRSTCGVPR